MDEMLARLATFALLPPSVAVLVSALRLARLGYFYSSPAQTLVCFRCQRTFRVDNEVSELQRHEEECSSPAAATASTISAPQHQPGFSHDHQCSSFCSASTSSGFTNQSSCQPTHLDWPLTQGYEQVSHKETRHGDIDTNMSGQHGEMHKLNKSSTVFPYQPDFEHLKDETVRLLTFGDWPEKAADIVKPRELAKAGLFYTGQADRVQCAFCRGYIFDWEQGDRPAGEHRRHFPNCWFIRQLNDDGDVAAAAATSSPFTSSHPQHATGSSSSSGEFCSKLQQSFKVIYTFTTTYFVLSSPC